MAVSECKESQIILTDKTNICFRSNSMKHLRADDSDFVNKIHPSKRRKSVIEPVKMLTDANKNTPDMSSAFLLTDLNNNLPTQDKNPFSPMVDSSWSRRKSLSSIQDGGDFIKRKFKCLNTNNKDEINRLSDELLLKIFSWLPRFVIIRLTRVCKRWASLATDASLWRVMDLGGRAFRPGILGDIIDRGVTVLRLAKAEIPSALYTNSSFTTRSLDPCLLQYLDLSMAQISVSGLEHILSKCNRLVKLSLENCPLSSKVGSHIGRNPWLTTLNLCLCQNVSIRCVEFILTNCRRLESLNVGWAGMEKNTVTYLCRELSPAIHSLNICGARDKIDDEDIYNLCRSCPDLQQLDISDSCRLTSYSMECIIKYLRYLRYLAISRCYQIEPKILPSLRLMHDLTTLDIFTTLTDTAMEELEGKLGVSIQVNCCPFSIIARPTTGVYRTSIWGKRVRDNVV